MTKQTWSHTDSTRTQLYEDLYDRYGRPLEAAHHGEFLAISPTGATILGSTMLQVAQQATERFGSGNFLYQIGESTVGRWR